MQTNLTERLKKTGEHFYTQQFDWTFESHGSGCMIPAVDRILNGKVVAFDCYNRGESSTDMLFQKRIFIGIINDEDDGNMLRVSHCNDLLAHSTHSIIPSWYGELVSNPVLIAASIVNFLRAYSDYFLLPE